MQQPTMYCYKIITTLAALPAAGGTIVCSNIIDDFNLIDTSVSPPIFRKLSHFFTL